MRLVIFFLFQTFVAHALEYGIDAKQEGATPITRLQIFSERCSGSSYLNELLMKNFSFEEDGNGFGYKLIAERRGFGHKHFPAWFSLPIDQVVGPPSYYTFEENEETLFVILFRSPYDWLRSFCRSPHCAIPKLHGLSLGEFIRRLWEVDNDIKRKIGPFVDLNPITGKPFENVMRLRTAKIQNMLAIKDRVCNFYCINYEVLRDHPIEVLEEILQTFDLIPKKPFTNINYYKTLKRWNYKKKKYPPIPLKDLLYINEELDADLEEAIGYIIKDNPDEIE